MTNNTSLLDTAWKIAEKSHEGQLYGNEPYINHIQRVYNRVAIVKHAGVSDFCCAILHDTLEDTDFSPKEIQRIFGPQIYNAVITITRIKDVETYDEYLRRVSRNIISKTVKVCDLVENLSNCYKDVYKYKRLIVRYEKALITLSLL